MENQSYKAGGLYLANARAEAAFVAVDKGNIWDEMKEWLNLHNLEPCFLPH